jgi:WD40 repeat protein/Tfp pilus assembly protein PilF
MAILATAIIFLSVSVAAGWFWWDSRQKAVEANAARDEAIRTGYVATVNLAEKEFEQPNPSRATKLLLDVARAPGSSRLLDFGWRNLWSSLHTSKSTIPGIRSKIYAVASNGARRSLFIVSNDPRLPPDQNEVLEWDTDHENVVAEFGNHKKGAAAIAVSPKDSSIATGGLNDGTVTLWQTGSWQPLWSRRLGLEGRPTTIHKLEFSPDGSTIFAYYEPLNASTDAKFSTLMYFSHGVEVLNAADGILEPGPNVSDVRSIAVAPKGTLFAAGKGNAVSFFNLKNKQEVSQVDLLDNYANVLAFSPDGQRLAVGGTRLQLVDIARGQIVESAREHAENITAILYSPDGSVIYTCSLDGTVAIYSAAPLRRIGRLYSSIGPLSAIALLTQERLAAGGINGGAEVWTLPLAEAPLGDHATMAPDGRTVALWDGEAHSGRAVDGSAAGLALYDVLYGREYARVQTGAISGAWFIDNGKSLVLNVSAPGGETARLYDSLSLQQQPVPWHRNGSAGVVKAVSRDGVLGILSFAENANVLLRFPAKPITDLPRDGGRPVSFAVESIGDTAAVASHTSSGILWQLFSLDSGKLIQETHLDKSDIPRDASSQIIIWPNGNCVAARSEWHGPTTIWAPRSEKSVTIDEPVSVIAPGSSACDAALGMVDGSIRVLSGSDFHIAKLAQQETQVTTLAWSSIGNTLASGGEDETIRLWDRRTGLQLRRIPIQMGRIGSLTFLPDSLGLAVGNFEDDVRRMVLLSGLSVRDLELYSVVREASWYGDLVSALHQTEIEKADLTLQSILSREASLNMARVKSIKAVSGWSALKIGRYHAEIGDYESAIRLFEWTNRINGSDAIGIDQEIQTAKRIRQYPAIIAARERVREAHNIERTEPERAIAILSETIAMLERNNDKTIPPPQILMQALLSLGVLHWNDGNLEAAEEDWTKAKTKFPQEGSAISNLGFVKFERGEYTDASKLFQQALLVAEGDRQLAADATAGLAVAEFRAGDTERALQNFDRAIKLDERYSSPKWLREEEGWTEKASTAAKELLAQRKPS